MELKKQLCLEEIGTFNKENMTKQERKKYLEKIVGYIKTIKTRKKYKLPFDLEYDCTGKIKREDYGKISRLINTAENIGAIVLGKRNMFFYREEIKPISHGQVIRTNNGIVSPIISEGDKSFVPKVNIEFDSMSNANSNEVKFLFQGTTSKKINNNQHEVSL